MTDNYEVEILPGKTVSRYTKETCLRVARVFINETIEDENFNKEALYCMLSCLEEAFNTCADVPFTVKINTIFTPVDREKEGQQ